MATKKAAAPEDVEFDAEEVRIDQCIPRQDPKTGEFKTYYRVYYWAERPDAANYDESDQYHWHPDSEHETEEDAKARVKELTSGAKRKSIYAGPRAAAKTLH